MKEQQLVTGSALSMPNEVGQLDPARLQELVDELIQLEVVDPDKRLALPDWVDTEFLPKHAGAPADGRP
jgi:hypothetical protein